MDANYFINKFKTDVFTTIIGQDQVKEQLKSALVSNRHIILVGQPGLGKTTLAKSVAQLLPDAPFVRVQGSPDLTAEDLLGDIDPIKALEFGPLAKEAFTPGKIFEADKGVLFFDEVNRCPAKLQNALLQVLEEGYATVGSYKVDFPSNFIFIGTMNPSDNTTEQLSHVFLDRFDLIYVEHPKTIDEEVSILETKQTMVEVPDKIKQFIVGFVQRLRKSDNVLRAPSVRATLGLYERAQANALLDGDKVQHKHVFRAIMSVLPHRLELKPSVKYITSPEAYIQEELRKFARDQGVDGEEMEGDAP